MQDDLFELVRRCNQIMGETDAVYHGMAAELGLSDSALRVLYTIHTEGGVRCPLQDVLRGSGLCKQTVNSTLRRLEAQGMAVLDRAQGRGKDVCLTAAGRRLVQRTAARVFEAERAVFAAWTDQELAQYLALNEKYLRDIRRQAAGMRGPAAE